MASPSLKTLSPRMPRSPSPTGAESGAGWGHFWGDGTFHSDVPKPRVRYNTGSRSGSPEPAFGRTLSTSLIDGVGSDRTTGVSEAEEKKVWSSRSFSKMADHGTIPSGLPLGLTDTEKKLWLALYCKAREFLQSGEQPSVRAAVDAALNAVTEKHSLEYRFGVRWQHSVKSCLAMRQTYRSSDVYS